MIIDKNYLNGRIAAILDERSTYEDGNRRLGFIKYGLPIPGWLRRIAFHPLNPVYSIWKQCRASKHGKQPQWDWLTPDIFRYCIEQDSYRLDTAAFARPDDEVQIAAWIDNQLRAVFQIPFVQHVRPERGYDAFIHYGLDQLPRQVSDYVAGKDFIDCGAYQGDSALFMLKYKPRRIRAFEPVSAGYALLERTIRDNGLEDTIIPVKKGLSDAPTQTTIYLNTTGSSLQRDWSGEGLVETIDISTLDDECRELNVGVIKMDIEGSEYAAVKGALKTIRRCRPVLLISVYHTGRDFFEIPPMIQALDADYRFQWVDLEPDALHEKILAAYPGEL